MSTAAKEAYKLGQNDRFLKKTFGRYLIPTMVGTLGGTINVLVDGIIVGQKIGSDGLAAVSICMPVYLLLCTVGSLLVSGGCVCSSREIGSGDMKKAVRIFNSVTLYAAAVSIIITVIGGLLAAPAAAVLSGGGSLYEMVYDYSLVTLLGSAAKIMVYIPIYYLRLDGKSKQSSVCALIMTAANAALDLLLIFGLDMGITGAALASVIASASACAVGFVFLAKSDNFRFRLEFEKPRLLLSVVKFGSPAAMDNLMSALRVLFLNSALLSFGGNIMVSVFSVVNSLSEFALFAVNGIPQTAAPIIGIYSAERNKGGLAIMLRQELRAAAISVISYGALISVFSAQIGALFGVDCPVTGAVVCLAAGLAFGSLNNILAGYYSSSGHVAIANTITVSRIFVCTVITLTALIRLGGYVWLFLPLTEILTLLLTLGILAVQRAKNRSRTFFLLNDKGSDEHVLDFSVSSSSEEICSASEKISDFCGENDMSPAQTMKISLAIEEILTIMTQKCFGDGKEHTFDLRAFSTAASTGIRIRCLGRKFNPITLLETDENGDESMGVKIIAAMAKSVDYQCVFGANSLMIII